MNIDLRDKSALSKVINAAKIHVSGTTRQKAELLSKKMDACDERGYHQVEREPADKKALMICYDCDLFFDRNFAENIGLKYKVNPIV